MKTIAMHPDDYTSKTAPEKSDAASPRWAALLEDRGFRVKWVNARSADILDQLQGCDGFMWRWNQAGGMGSIARRLLPVIENTLGLAVYPDQRTCWHYDDKIAQAYLLKALGIPTPETWIWFDYYLAQEWARIAPYPLVCKLATGSGSQNVRLVETPQEARLWIQRLFNYRLVTLDDSIFHPYAYRQRVEAALQLLRRGSKPLFRYNGYEAQGGYALFQKFLPDNVFDTRITVIGNRAFGFRRHNRENDFRASGSGRIDYDIAQIDPQFVRLAFQTAQAVGSQSCAIDGLYDDGRPVVGEISYTYISSAVHDCPGHWVLQGSDPLTAPLEWVAGQMWPEEAQIEDFVERLK